MAAHEQPPAAEGTSSSLRYPEHLMPLAGQLPPKPEPFAAAREELLLGYGYRTARAYWSDLEHMYDWATERGFDVMELTDKQLTQYRALLRRRRYSESTVRRRMVAWGLLRKVGGQVDVR